MLFYSKKCGIVAQITQKCEIFYIAILLYNYDTSFGQILHT